MLFYFLMVFTINVIPLYETGPMQLIFNQHCGYWCFSTRASVATVLSMPSCISRRLRVNIYAWGQWVKRKLITRYGEYSLPWEGFESKLFTERRLVMQQFQFIKQFLHVNKRLKGQPGTSRLPSATALWPTPLIRHDGFWKKLNKQIQHSP